MLDGDPSTPPIGDTPTSTVTFDTETLSIVRTTAREQSSLLKEMQGDNQVAAVRKDPEFVMLSEKVRVIEAIYREIDSIKDLLKEDDNAKNWRRTVVRGVAKISQFLTVGAISHSNKSFFGRLAANFASLLEPPIREGATEEEILEDSVQVVWIPVKIDLMLANQLREASNNLRSRSIEKISDNVRGKVSNLFNNGNVLRQNLAEFYEKGGESVLELAKVMALKHVLNRKLGSLDCELDKSGEQIDREEIAAKLHGQYLDNLRDKAIESRDVATAMPTMNSEGADGERTRILGEVKIVALGNESDIQELVDKAKDELAKSQRIPFGWVRLRQRLDELDTQESDLNDHIENLSDLCEQVIRSLKTIKAYKKTGSGPYTREDSEPFSEDEIAKMVAEVLVDIQFPDAIYEFDTLSKPRTVKLSKRTNIAIESLARFFGIHDINKQLQDLNEKYMSEEDVVFDRDDKSPPDDSAADTAAPAGSLSLDEIIEIGVDNEAAKLLSEMGYTADDLRGFSHEHLVENILEGDDKEENAAKIKAAFPSDGGGDVDESDPETPLDHSITPAPDYATSVAAVEALVSPDADDEGASEGEGAGDEGEGAGDEGSDEGGEPADEGDEAGEAAPVELAVDQIVEKAGVNRNVAVTLIKHGFATEQALRNATREDLIPFKGLGEVAFEKIKAAFPSAE